MQKTDGVRGFLDEQSGAFLANENTVRASSSAASRLELPVRTMMSFAACSTASLKRRHRQPRRAVRRNEDHRKTLRAAGCAAGCLRRGPWFRPRPWPDAAAGALEADRRSLSWLRTGCAANRGQPGEA